MTGKEDLTTLFVGHIRTLKAANVTARDVTTLVIKAQPTVRAANVEEVNDYNTLYMDYLD